MARTRRTKGLVAAALIVVLVVGAVVAYRWREARQADAALERAGISLKKDVQQFHRDHNEFPLGLHLRNDTVELVGTTATRTSAVEGDSGIRLAWYSGLPDPRLSTSAQLRSSGYAYCLDVDGRHWRINANDDVVAVHARAHGRCPAAPAP